MWMILLYDPDPIPVDSYTRVADVNQEGQLVNCSNAPNNVMLTGGHVKQSVRLQH